MASKFGRNYLLSVDTRSHTTLTIQPPFTIEFDITRNTLTSANVCQIRIYNLSLNSRNQLRFNADNFGEYRQVVLRAGYGANLPIIFQGNVSQAWSVREGTNFITQIECFDGGFAFNTGKTGIAFTSGIPDSAKIFSLFNELPRITPGAIGNYSKVSSRGNSFSGATPDLISGITGENGFFIDTEKAYALGDNEFVFDSLPLVIDARSGLLGTPILEQSIVRFDMLFEPGLVPGRSAELRGITETIFNGIYKITAVKHRGMISEAVCGDCVTTGDFFFSERLIPVPPL